MVAYCVNGHITFENQETDHKTSDIMQLPVRHRDVTSYNELMCVLQAHYSETCLKRTPWGPLYPLKTGVRFRKVRFMRL